MWFIYALVLAVLLIIVFLSYRFLYKELVCSISISGSFDSTGMTMVNHISAMEFSPSMRFTPWFSNLFIACIVRGVLSLICGIVALKTDKLIFCEIYGMLFGFLEFLKLFSTVREYRTFYTNGNEMKVDYKKYSKPAFFIRSFYVFASIVCCWLIQI